MPGTLYVLATPIGNLSDITLRAIETLKSVDLVACEDTRHSEKLLRHLDIKKPLIRYDEHSHTKASISLQKELKSGKNIALLSDAGTPGISDPGSRLVSDVLAEGLPVVPIPGVSSLTAALSVSGLKGDEFIFLGFLPRKRGPATRLLQQGSVLGKTVVILESPFRAVATLELIEELMPEKTIVVAREMTKIHEEFVRGTAQQVLKKFAGQPVKGEFVILIGTPHKSEHQDPQP